MVSRGAKGTLEVIQGTLSYVVPSALMVYRNTSYP